MKITYTLPKNTAQLSRIIAEATSSANTMKEKVQRAAIAILHHTYHHGDYTKANDLVDGLGHGVKRDSLVAFFVELGGLTVGVGTKGFIGWKGKEHIKANFEAAKSTMWYDYKKEEAFKGYNLEDKIINLIKSHQSTMKKVKGMSPEDQAKVDVAISEATIKQVLSLINFDIIEEEELTVEEQIAEALKVA